MQEILISPAQMGVEALMEGMIACSRAINDILYGGYQSMKELEDYIQELSLELDKREKGGEV